MIAMTEALQNDAVNPYGLESSRAQELVAAATAMGPALRERSARASRDQRVPDETVAQFREAGFFRILQPEQWGGYAMDPQVFYAVGLEVARFCPSSAWILGVIAVHNWQLAVLTIRQRRMCGRMIPRFLSPPHMRQWVR